MLHVQAKIQCPACGYSEDYTRLLIYCPSCGGTYLDAAYEVTGGQLPWPGVLRDRPASMWRYRELLPLTDDAHIVTMGEGYTPLIRAEHLGAMLGLRHLYIKDERQGPTASFKDRQASLAISTLREFGISELVVASTGNVAIAYSAYAARARVSLTVFTISSVPSEKMREVMIYGSELVKVTGTYDQAKQLAARYADSKGLTLDRGIKSIAAKEAMKTISFELAEQLGEIYGPHPDGTPWRSPDWYIQGVSGGLGPIGVVKGFRELERFGLCKGRPRLGNIQTSGCDPMVRAFKAGLEDAPPFLQPKTRIATLATDVPGIAYKLLREDALAYGGAFESVSDEEAFDALRKVAQLEGLSVEPATAVGFAGLVKLVRQGLIHPDEIVVVNCTGHTFPVEKHLLSNEIRDVDVTPATRNDVPHEGLLAALTAIDANIERILIIEDDVNASELMSRILKAYGAFQVIQAYDGETGIRMAEDSHPDLILLDLMMPGIDGFGVLDHLKGSDTLQNVPVVVVTAKDLTSQERARLVGQVETLLQKGSFMDDSILQDLIKEKLT